MTIDTQDSTYTFSFKENEQNILITSDFYVLLDAALYEGKVVGNILSSNTQVLYMAISNKIGLLDNVDLVLSDNELLLSIVILDTNTNVISNINTKIDMLEFPLVNILFDESETINFENYLYGELPYVNGILTLKQL